MSHRLLVVTMRPRPTSVLLLEVLFLKEGCSDAARWTRKSRIIYIPCYIYKCQSQCAFCACSRREGEGQLMFEHVTMAMALRN